MEVSVTERDTTAGVLVDGEGLYLVAQRKEGGPLSRKWEFIGGKNRYGESLAETLKREWMEEVGLEIEVDSFLLNTEFVNNGVHYTLHCFSVRLLSGSETINLTVHDDVRWVTKDELKDLDFGPSDSVIRAYITGEREKPSAPL